MFVLCLTCWSFGQADSSWNKRSWLVAGSNVAVGGGSVALLGAVWYNDYPKSDFHFFNDASNWMYMDKLGHSFTAYQLSRTEYAAWKWARLPRKKAIWLSGGIAWTYQLSVEVLDGFSSEWGFSIADVSANTVGSVLFVAQELAWDQQRFQLKFGYHASPYAALRPDILGGSFSERLLKDYNAQSYWLCFSPQTFFPKSHFPSWIQLGVGYSADAKLKGDANVFSIDGVTYHAQREWALSFDIDWNRVPIRRPWLRKAVQPLSVVKIPFPSLFWRKGVCYVGMF